MPSALAPPARLRLHRPVVFLLFTWKPRPNAASHLPDPDPRPPPRPPARRGEMPGRPCPRRAPRGAQEHGEWVRGWALGL